jgi:hypothetical protein
MTTGEHDDLTDDEILYFAALDAAAALADRCKQLRGKDFRDPLGHVMNHLLTELWDRSFSQSEIRAAFIAAVDDMNRYEAGQERR